VPSTSAINLRGQVRAYPYVKSNDFAPNRLFIHWSPDNWKTIYDTAATPNVANQTFSWDFKISSNTLLPSNVVYAIKYVTAVGEFWNNNQGANFAKTVKPILELSNPDLQSSNATLNGLVNIGISSKTDLALDAPYWRVDGKDYSNALPYVELNTQNLGEGNHILDVQLRLQGNGPVALDSPGYRFKVRNSMKHQAQWIPTLPPQLTSGVSWSNNVDKNGKFWVSFDAQGSDPSANTRIIARYTSFGTPNPPEQVYTIPENSAYILRTDIDNTTGNLYVLTNNLKIYAVQSTTGALLTSFGNSGILDLSTQVCYIGDIKVLSPFLFISDTCNRRILKLDSTTGSPVSEPLIVVPDGGFTGALGQHENGTLVAIADFYEKQESYFLNIDPASFVVTSTITSRFFGGIASVAPKDGNFWISQYSSLYVISGATGNVIAEWNGAGGQSYGADGTVNTPGRIAIAKSVCHLPDLGGVTVLGVEGNAIQKFDFKLYF
jgi:hypothetical protein